MISRMVKESEMKKDSLDPCGEENSVARSMTGKRQAGQRGMIKQREKVQKMRKEKEGGGGGRCISV